MTTATLADHIDTVGRAYEYMKHYANHDFPGDEGSAS